MTTRAGEVRLRASLLVRPSSPSSPARASLESGSGTWLAVAGVLLASVVVVAVIAGGVVIAAQNELRRAADLVALSAATARASDDDPCRAAARLAAANQVAVAACTTVGDDLDFAVTVVVTRRVALLHAGLDVELTATANAGWLSTPG